jgi:hypothetical protein
MVLLFGRNNYTSLDYTHTFHFTFSRTVLDYSTTVVVAIGLDLSH